MPDADILTVCQAFYRTVNRLPDHTAQLFNPDLYDGDNNGKFTYGEMRGRVERIAGALMAMGFEKNDRAAIMSSNSPYWTHADMAIANAAGVSVAIYPTLSRDEVRFILTDSGCKFLFVRDQEMMEKMRPLLGEVPTLERIIVMRLSFKSGDERVLGLLDVLKMGEEYLAEHRDEYENRWRKVTLDDWYTILYTSGTTGRNKGAIITHWAMGSRAVGANEYFARHDMSLTENDVTLLFLQLAHIFDRGSGQLIAIWNGATMAYGDKPSTIIQDFQKYNPTWFNCVPRLYERIYMQLRREMEKSALRKRIFVWALKVGKEALKYRMDGNGCYNMSPNFDLKSRLPLGLRIKYSIADRIFAKVRALFGSRFRYAFSASAGIDPELLKFYYTLGIAVVEGYGLTESTNACCSNPLTACKPGTVGPPANGSVGRVAEDGEFEMSGAGVFKGYLNLPEETAAVFTPDGWFKTGDIVTVDEQGYVKVIDRKKAIICLDIGKNVAPQKLEQRFSTSIAVEQVFFIGDERPYISALVVPNFDYFAEIYEKQGIAYNKEALRYSNATGAPICVEVGRDFVEQPLLKETIAAEVEAVNATLEEFEKIRKYTVLSRRFTEDEGELTPTLKTKKRVVLDKYRDIIEDMYAV